jgi:hypothetical protein
MEGGRVTLCGSDSDSITGVVQYGRIQVIKKIGRVYEAVYN